MGRNVNQRQGSGRFRMKILRSELNNSTLSNIPDSAEGVKLTQGSLGDVRNGVICDRSQRVGYLAIGVIRHSSANLLGFTRTITI